MTRRALVLLATLPLLGSAAYRPDPMPTPPARELTVYELAERETGAPAEILRGLAFAESGERDGAIGDGGESIGRFQLREIYHDERARLYGEYSPTDAREAAIIAGRLYMDNLAALGSEELAVTAHKWGRTGARVHGVDQAYVAKVRTKA